MTWVRTQRRAIGLAMVLLNVDSKRVDLVWTREIGSTGGGLAVSPETIKGPEEDSSGTPLDDWRAAWRPNSAGRWTKGSLIAKCCGAYEATEDAQTYRDVASLCDLVLARTAHEKRRRRRQQPQFASCTVQC